MRYVKLNNGAKIPVVNNKNNNIDFSKLKKGYWKYYPLRIYDSKEKNEWKEIFDSLDQVDIVFRDYKNDKYYLLNHEGGLTELCKKK